MERVRQHGWNLHHINALPDLPVRITLGRLTLRRLEQRGLPVPEAYCRLPNNVPFDFLERELLPYGLSAAIPVP